MSSVTLLLSEKRMPFCRKTLTISESLRWSLADEFAFSESLRWALADRLQQAMTVSRMVLSVIYLLFFSLYSSGVMP